MADHTIPGPRANRAHLRLLHQLTEAVAVSGDEAAVRAIVRRELAAFADDMHVDALGNLLVIRKGCGRRRVRVMLAAHMDEVGLMITAVEKDGTLRVGRVGGLDVRQLAGKPVWVGRARHVGVIGVKPIHLLTASEKKKALSLDNLRIDIGADSREAAQRKVQPGDRATFATPFARLGPTVRAKALDDRLGVASLIELVRSPPPGIDLLAAFTVQEEVGLRGARVAAFALAPQAAIALDATPARDFPIWDEETENTQYNTRLGAGPAIYVADGATIGDPRLLRLLVETAESEAIPYQIRQPGRGGTDAGAIHLTREGIPSISLSVPARNLHGAASIASLKDWRDSVRLVYAALARLTPATLRGRRS